LRDGLDLKKTEISNPIRAYGQWLASTQENWEEKVIESALMQFIDVIAVMIPGSKEEVSKKVLSTVEMWGKGPSSLVGSTKTLSPIWASLVNGTSAHALDFDDNFDPPKAHASAVLVPAILALAEQENSSGLACLDAYICGLQIMGRVGQGLNPYHRNRGWHATATVGAIGAAAGCIRLLNLNPKQSAYGLSISTSMASGFMSQFGTMVKPIHAGLAAKSGILAASLAKNHITAGLDTLDGDTGMNHLMIGPDYTLLRDSIENPEHGQTLRFETKNVGDPLLITHHGFRVKRFPNCGSAHRAMDALIKIKEKVNLSPDTVDKIIVTAPQSHLNNLMYNDPKDPYQAKFSMEFALSLIMLSGNCTLKDFSMEKVNDPSVRSIYKLISLKPIDKSESEIPTEVKVILKDNSFIEEKVFFPVGSKNLPFTNREYWDKFDNCAKEIISEENYLDLCKKLENFTSLDSISDLMKLMR